MRLVHCAPSDVHRQTIIAIIVIKGENKTSKAVLASTPHPTFLETVTFLFGPRLIPDTSMDGWIRPKRSSRIFTPDLGTNMEFG
ncbi:hypothetical protein CDAR_63671 [Caerostris darwini]|uniref:Uncharacterized protein n=1 Tax=Caerostris darwini TaxID=1538125 RepID=A0AAV4TBC5_9ARAC|nr:hypothetical protein CDAR_63671 [Caerostris darwini]